MPLDLDAAAAQADSLIPELGLDAKATKVLSREDKAPLKHLLAALVLHTGARAQAQLLYVAASKANMMGAHLEAVAAKIAGGELATSLQVDEGARYLAALEDGAAPDWAAFDVAAGVGVEISDEELEAACAEAVAANREAIVEERYRFNVMSMMAPIKEHPRLKFADVAAIKPRLQGAVEELLGPRTAEDEAAAGKKKKKKAPKPAKAAPAPAAETKAEDEEPEDILGEGLVGRSIPAAQNTPELLAEHRAAVGDTVRMRFPPEPNGYLHVGHSKAMQFNFEGSYNVLGVDESRRDVTLRYDDTNPDKESVEFIESIRENLEWMGWTPTRVTYSSDYFDRLYDCAVELIRRGKAYVCHQTKPEMEATREECKSGGERIHSPWRARSVEDNLRLFEDMRKGRFAEGAATLRMKIDMTHNNPNMWDPVAYRIKYTPHPHAGDGWCIYPTYDYTHCLVDSFEHIDYSLCTLEFETRRESYYWVLEALDLYRPMVWESSRLGLTYTVMSKRFLRAMVESGEVRGWSDPRLPTIQGLRRRGIPAEALNELCRQVGVTRKINTTQMERLQACVRNVVDPVCHRVMGVLRPLRVVLENWDEARVEVLQVPNLPATLVQEGQPDPGTHASYFSKVLFIDRDDFREEDARGYYGLAPGKEVNLKHAYNITCTGVERDAAGNVVELRATVDESKANKCKGHLHWVGCRAPGQLPRPVEVRLYEHLFTRPDPIPKKGVDPRQFVREDSEVVLTDCLVDDHIHDCPPLTRFQFERVGYFVVDQDTAPGKPVFNRIQALRSSKK